MTRLARPLATPRCIVAFIALLMPVASAYPNEAAKPEKAASCSIRVSVSSFEPHDCVVTASESLITVEWGKNPKFKVRLERQSDDGASLSVDGIDLRTPVGLQLGDVAFKDDENGCWEGNGNKVCYTLQSEIDEEIAGDKAEYDEGDAPAPVATPPDLSKSLAGAAAVQGMMCLLTEEELNRPGNRAFMRGMARGNLAARVPQWKSFTLAANGDLLVDGVSAKLGSRDGGLVIAHVWNGITRNQLPPTFSAEEQQDWQQAQDFMQVFGEGFAQSSGLDQRVYVLDFEGRTGQLATLQNDTLIEQQQILCD